MLQKVIIIDDLDEDGYYEITPETILCFPFMIEENTELKVLLTHTALYSQDNSLRCWFSSTPNGQMLFKNDDVDVFPMRRNTSCFIFGDNHLIINPNKTYYVNVQNLQNSNNIFKINFE